MLHKGHARPLVGGNSRAQLQSCYHQTPLVCHKHHSAAAAAAATGLAAAPRHSSNNNTLSGRPLLHTACEAIGNGHATTNNSSSSMPSSSCIPMMLIPMGVMTDSYKASHFLQYPEANKMVAVRHTVQAGGGATHGCNQLCVSEQLCPCVVAHESMDGRLCLQRGSQKPIVA